jgi:DNA-binding PadR family transcriptional regulator
MIDEPDSEILRQCRDKPEAILKDIIAPVQSRAKKTLYKRITRMESEGLLFLNREKFRGRTLCSITPDGLKTLMEYETTHPSEEVSGS